MSEKPEPDSDKLPEAEAEARFKRTLGNMLGTGPKPHKPKGPDNDSGGPADRPSGGRAKAAPKT
jgi:hypothetical protein